MTRLSRFLTMTAVVFNAALLQQAPHASAQEPQGFHRHGLPVDMSRLPQGLLKKDLEALPDSARQKALRILSGVSFPLEDAVSSMRADKKGDVYYQDPIRRHEKGAHKHDQEPSIEAIVASINTSSVFQLNSRPGATRVVYLNFRGQNVTGTAWNAQSGVSSHPMRPFSLDTDFANVSQQEANLIAEVWKNVSEDYAPFNINVTTQRPASFGPNVGHVLISPRRDANGRYIISQAAGGVAYLNTWGSTNFTYYQPALVFPDGTGNTPKAISEAASHELGHNLGLTHDGRTSPSEGYFQGHGSGNTSWAPIMGVGYYRNVSQWSRGEYQYANNTQDDVGIIAAKLTFRGDDHANATTGASLLQSSGGTVSVTTPVRDPSNTRPSNKGVIHNRSDVDYFYFDASSTGTVSLRVTPDWLDSFTTNSLRSANLDIRASLYNASGGLVSQSNVTTDTYAQISAPVTAGRYYLAIEGVGYGSALSGGYSDYGSIGRYFISGTVPAAAGATIAMGTPAP